MGRKRMKFTVILAITVPLALCQTNDGLKLLAVGGYSGPDVLTDVEMVDPFHPGPSHCNHIPPPFPVPVSGNTLQTFPMDNNTLTHVSCGGLVQNPDMSLDYTNLCYRYWPESNQWKPIEMARSRSSSASVLINNDREMWIIGGTGDFDSLSTSEILDINSGEVSEGPDLPVDMAFHCAVKISENMVFIAGAEYGRFGTSYLVDVTQRPFAFEKLPATGLARESPACGAFRISAHYTEMDEADAVIVAGGDHYTPPLGSVRRVQSSSEIFLLRKRQWVHQGPNLPRGFNLGGFTTNLETNSVILAGGFGEHYDDHSDIIQFESKSQSFQIMPGRLSKSKHLFGLTSFVDEIIC